MLMNWDRCLAPWTPEVTKAVEQMELGYDQIDRIRRLKTRVDSGIETDPQVIFDVQQLTAVISAFLQVGRELRTLRTQLRGEAEVIDALALWEAYRVELGL